jgi:glutathione S-transferase
MLFLYHAAPSVCSIKVRVTLAEKDLAWDGKILDLQRGDQFQPDYRKINPNAVVPTLIHDGRTILESTIIIEYLNDAFPTRPLMPSEAFSRATARRWMKKIDDYLHGDCAALTFAIAFRRMLQQKTPEELEVRFASIPNPAMRERQRDAVQRGLDAPHAAAALCNYDKFIREMDEALALVPYLAGEQYSLADAAVTPYINRAAMLKLDGLWKERPGVAAWFTRMRERPSYEQGITKFLTDHQRKIFDIPAGETWRKAKTILEKYQRDDRS